MGHGVNWNYTDWDVRTALKMADRSLLVSSCVLFVLMMIFFLNLASPGHIHDTARLVFRCFILGMHQF